MLLTLLLAGCPSHAPAPTPSAVDAPPRGGIPVPGLLDVACDGVECRALTASGVVELPGLAPVASWASAGWDTLRVEDHAWTLEGACASASRCAATLADGGTTGERPLAELPAAQEDPGLPLAEAARGFTAAWNAGIAAGWRSGFSRVVVGPGGAAITWLRGLDGAGQLVRTSPGARTVRLGGAQASVSWPAWLALHPTGTEAYLVAWPAPTVRAFDPATLEPRWTLALDGAAAGLFVDGGGRWLLVSEGSPSTDRLVDWPCRIPDPAAPSDPWRDEVLRTFDRPPSDATVVIDLATHTVVARARGPLRRFLPLPDRPVLATDREVVFVTPGDPS